MSDSKTPTIETGGVPMLHQDPYSFEALDEHYQKLVAKKETIEKAVAPLRKELADAASVAEQYRNKAMDISERLNQKFGEFFPEAPSGFGRKFYIRFKNRLGFIAKTRQAQKDKIQGSK